MKPKQHCNGRLKSLVLKLALFKILTGCFAAFADNPQVVDVINLRMEKTSCTSESGTMIVKITFETYPSGKEGDYEWHASLGGESGATLTPATGSTGEETTIKLGEAKFDTLNVSVVEVSDNTNVKAFSYKRFCSCDFGDEDGGDGGGGCDDCDGDSPGFHHGDAGGDPAKGAGEGPKRPAKPKNTSSEADMRMVHRFTIGGDWESTSYLKIDVRKIADTASVAYSYTGLDYVGKTGAGFTTGNVLTGIITPAGKAKVVNTQSNGSYITGYDLLVYANSSSSTSDNKFEVRKLGTTGVKITDTERQLVHEYVYTKKSGSTNEKWQVTKYKSGSAADYLYRKITELEVDDNSYCKKLITVSGYNGRTGNVETTAKSRITYTKEDFGYFKSKEEVFDTTSNVKYTTTITAYTSGDEIGKVHTITAPSGGVTTYTYESDGKTNTITMPFENGTSRVIDYDYNGGSTYTWVKTEKIGTTVVGKTYFKADTTNKTYTTKRCLSNSATWTTSSNLVTIKKRDSSNRLSEITHPDGTKTTYTHTTGSDYSEGIFSNEKYHQTKVETGSTLYGDVVTTKTSDWGQVLEEKREAKSNGSLYTVHHSQAISFDDHHRIITRQLAHVGDRINRTTYDCCGMEWDVDDRGVATYYERDVLGRVTRTKTGAADVENTLAFSGDVTDTEHRLDALGRVTKVIRHESPSHSHVAFEAAYNLAGEKTWSIDGLGSTSIAASQTKYSRATLTGDGHEEIISRPRTGPSGAQGYPTEHRVYFEDGRLKTVKKYGASAQLSKTAISGTTVEWIEYDYGADSDGEHTTETSRGAGGAGVSRWTKTHYDFAGRIRKQTAPDANGSPTVQTHQYYYYGISGSAKGKLTRTVDWDGVTMHLLYNSKGQRNSQLLDDHASGASHSDTYDRRTATIEEFGAATVGTGTVRRIENKIYPNEGSATSFDHVVTETSLDGLDIWRKTRGQVTHTEISLPAFGDGTWTVTTSHPDGSDTVETYDNGRLEERRRLRGTSVIEKQTHTYDLVGRLDTVDDARFGATEYQYHDNDALYRIAAPNPTDKTSSTGKLYTYHTLDYGGNTIEIKHPDNSKTYYDHHQNGLLKKQHGARTKDISYTYDDHGGNLETMETGYGSGSAKATTTWAYHAGRGWLVEKEDDDGNKTTYTYTNAGRLKTRTRPRTGSATVVTTYVYFPNGDLKFIKHNDSTHDVLFAYDRMGRPTVVQDGSWIDGLGAFSPLRYTHTYTYHSNTHANHPLELYHEKIEGVHSSARYLTRKYQTTVPNRSAGFRVGTSVNSSAHLDITYGYKADDGRLETVASHGDTYTYAYTDNQIQPSSLSGPGFTTNHAYQSGRPTLSHQENKTGGGTLVSKYAWEYDSRTRRTKKKMTGATLFGSNGKRNVYGYNDDDEVDEADRYNHATSGGTLADDWTYSFDGIGNRLSAVGPDTGNGTNISYTYTPSNTNSYTQIKRSGANQNPVHDKDGNMTDRGNLDFIWDAENRLIEVQGTGSTVKYDYDYLGRRVKRQANGSTETYLYDGWNPVVTYDNGTTTRKHTYTWGADYGTGGVGALIACRKHSNSKDHVYFYDGHGNVTQIMDQTNKIVVHYEYDAFGNLTKNVNQDGSGFNNENPFRFSTKFFNDETDHYYYGYRYYDPRDGRWLNRDPIGEQGGPNLYGFVGNDGVNRWDYLGMKKIKITVDKCEAYLFVGHTEARYDIDWDLNGMCAIGGAIGCDPKSNQPTDEEPYKTARKMANKASRGRRFPSSPRWPNLPYHSGDMFAGTDTSISEAAKRNYRSDYNSDPNHPDRDEGPASYDFDDPRIEHDIEVAVQTATDSANLNAILVELCGACCDEVKFIIDVRFYNGRDLVKKHLKKQGWEKKGSKFEKVIGCDEPVN